MPDTNTSQTLYREIARQSLMEWEGLSEQEASYIAMTEPIADLEFIDQAADRIANANRSLTTKEKFIDVNRGNAFVYH